MKFGRRLQEEAYEPYAGHYIGYKELKKAIKVITGADTSECTIAEVTQQFSETGALAGSAQRPPEARFQALLNFETTKINNFATLVYMTTTSNLHSLTSKIPLAATLDALEMLHSTAEAAADGVLYLHAFVQLNLTGFRKITKKFDKHSCGSSSTWYMSHLSKEPFVNMNFDVLIKEVAHCFQLLYQQRMILSNLPYSDPVVGPSSPLPIQTTHFVSEDDIMQARLYLTKYLPLVSIGQSGASSDVPSDTFSSSKLETKGNKLSMDENQALFKNPSIVMDSQSKVSHGCLYFDNPDAFDTYRSVLRNINGSQLAMASPEHCSKSILRLRWPVVRSPPQSDSQTKMRKSVSTGVISKAERTGSRQADVGDSALQTSPFAEMCDHVLLEFVDPFGRASDPHEWFNLPFDNHLDTPLSASAVLLSTAEADALLKNQFNVPQWISKQKHVYQGALSEERTQTMAELLQKAIDTIHRDKHFPLWQRWCHRTTYSGVLLDCNNSCYSSSSAGCPDELSSTLSDALRTSHVYLDENISFVVWDSNSALSLADQMHQVSALINPVTFKLTCGVLVMERAMPFEFLLRLMGSTTIAEVSSYSSLVHGTSVLYREKFGKADFPRWAKFVANFDSHADDEAQRSERLSTQRVSVARNVLETVCVDVVPVRPNEKVLYDHVATEQSRKDLPVQIAELTRSLEAEQPYAESQNRRYVQLSQHGQQSLSEPLLHDTRVKLFESSRNIEPSMAPSLSSRIRAQVQNLCSTMFRRTPVASTVKCQEANIRVEPKTFFANERTLLQWMNTAVLISTISVTLLNFSNETGRVAGYLLAPIAIFFIVYSFSVYLRRSRCLKTKEPINYDDRLGPAILVISLTTALSLILALNLM